MTVPVPRILVVDSNIGAATRLSVHLQRLGVHVGTAFTTVSAELVAREFGPDVVIADDHYGSARLQGLRAVLLGTEACRHDARFICLVQSSSAGRALVEAGFHAAWLKPVTLDGVLDDLQAPRPEAMAG